MARNKVEEFFISLALFFNIERKHGWRTVLVKKHGAEILRLWVSASDYRDDIRISDNILKQLSDAYRRIRNTSRFMLGNLYDFNPENDTTPYASMLEIDQFALSKLGDVIQKSKKAYPLLFLSY